VFVRQLAARNLSAALSDNHVKTPSWKVDQIAPVWAGQFPGSALHGLHTEKARAVVLAVLPADYRWGPIAWRIF
jgi:hypothetical protein